MHDYTSIISTPLGKIGLITEDEFLLRLHYVADDLALIAPSDPISKQVEIELGKYFSNPAHEFDLNFYFPATDFQLRVWQALREIPSGSTLTYSDLAKQLKSGPRAVGNACRTNPIAIIIPCHRIVAKNHLGGYAGNTDGKMMEIKKWLLNHEKQIAITTHEVQIS